MVQKNQKYKLGDILVQQGYLSDKQLKSALESQKKTKQRLGDYLIDSGIVSDKDIARALHIQLGIGIVELRGVDIPEDVISLVNGSILRKHNVLPLAFEGSSNNTLILVMSDPLDMVAQDDISIITNCFIEPRISTGHEINAVLDRYFGTDETLSAADKFTKEKAIKDHDLVAAAAEEALDLSSAPIVQIVKSIIEQAVRSRASDIHIDALEKELRVRYRIDGVLNEKMVYDLALLPALSARIKILGGMDIAEKRKPQDGRITVAVDRSEYDIRVAILPSYFGEKIVMRLANKAALTKTKAELGMRSDELSRFDHILSNPNGILLVTGPTGSGKSTTLYTALSELNSEAVNIITVEDPVEASIPGINQVQVNPKADLTFASALRSILRQDPDIIMIGEIRDYETASIAVQASITGHLVVSTLHTNSAAATVTRLMDMGIESYLLADSLVGVIAQRLVRKLCPHCKKARQAIPAEKRMLGRDVITETTVYDPVGCPMCADTGYFGRIGVYEIMEITQELKRLVATKGNTGDIQNVAISEGMKTLHMSAAEYVLDGTTSIAEMLRVSFDE
ncbi:MAG: Flp pilus assembly complex ATPase component TadA [Oscillospiraceae bacterium]|nr:Flp pilus assembly complex ATPase component TadA [Oscillospiraceae bacterium]